MQGPTMLPGEGEKKRSNSLQLCPFSHAAAMLDSGHLSLEDFKEEHAPHLDNKHPRVAVQNGHHLVQV